MMETVSAVCGCNPEPVWLTFLGGVALLLLGIWLLYTNLTGIWNLIRVGKFFVQNKVIITTERRTHSGSTTGLFVIGAMIAVTGITFFILTVVLLLGGNSG